MANITRVQLAKVTIGYEDFVLPIKEATKLVELLSSLVPVEIVSYALYSEFRPELEGKTVEKKNGLNVSLKLEDQSPLPYFDQEAELRLRRFEKYGPTVFPFVLNYMSSKYVVLSPEGVELFSDYGWSKALEFAQEQKTRFDERHQFVDTGCNKLTDGTSEIEEVNFRTH